MSLTFQAYQEQALSTAVYPRQYVLMAGTVVKENAPSCIYPIFGLCGEIGEVAQVITNKMGLRTDLIKECGDVLWYVAATCSDLSIAMSDIAGYNTFDDFDFCSNLINRPYEEEIVQELCIAAGIIAEATKKTIRDSDGVVTPARLAAIKAALLRILQGLRAICSRQNASLGFAAQCNLEKLAARAAKGTIGGSGDNR